MSDTTSRRSVNRTHLPAPTLPTVHFSSEWPMDTAGISRVGFGSSLRSILLLPVRGHSSTPTTSEGSMYTGNISRVAPSAGTWSSRRALHAGLSCAPRMEAGCTYATSVGSPMSVRKRTIASTTPGCMLSACSISPNSMRWPRSFTWKSTRPPNSISPLGIQRTRSPVR
eukprot:5366901-Prymnesium_polylepis.2